MTKNPPSGGRSAGLIMSEKRFSHAYMLLGPEGPERDAAARRLAAALLCPAANAPCGVCRDCRKVMAGIHPDVITVGRERSDKDLRSQILVGQIRAMTADAVLAPNEATRKVYIIAQADRMNDRAQNALLKALEDPPGHACFILCAAAADALLPTVRSRCVRAGDPAVRQESGLGMSELARAYLEAAASGDMAQVALCCMSRAGLSREETEAFAGQVKDAVCAILAGRADGFGLEERRLLRIAGLMDMAEDHLRHNVQPKQIFGLLAAETLR